MLDSPNPFNSGVHNGISSKAKGGGGGGVIKKECSVDCSKKHAQNKVAVEVTGTRALRDGKHLALLDMFF